MIYSAYGIGEAPTNFDISFEWIYNFGMSVIRMIRTLSEFLMYEVDASEKILGVRPASFGIPDFQIFEMLLGASGTLVIILVLMFIKKVVPFL
jgi:hypothetical protein